VRAWVLAMALTIVTASIVAIVVAGPTRGCAVDFRSRDAPVPELGGGWEVYMTNGPQQHKEQLRLGKNKGGCGDLVKPGANPMSGAHKMAEATFDARGFTEVLAVGNDGSWAHIKRTDGGAIPAADAFKVGAARGYELRFSDGTRQASPGNDPWGAQGNHGPFFVDVAFVGRVEAGQWMWCDAEFGGKSRPRMGKVLGTKGACFADENGGFVWKWYGRRAPAKLPAAPAPVELPVVVDDETDGGGWALLWCYAHKGGTNPELVPGTPPTSATDGFSHCTLKDLNRLYGTALRTDQIDEVRFFAKTSGHGRVMHFKSRDRGLVAMAAGDHGDPKEFNSGQGSGAGGWWGGGRWTALPGHTARLPAAGNGWWGSFSHYLVYQGGVRTWAIRGSGYRWEVDDHVAHKEGAGAEANREGYDGMSRTTLHQIWVRFAPDAAPQLRRGAVHAAGAFSVYVSSLSGRTTALRVEASHTVARVKEMYALEADVAASRLTLTHQNRPLADARTLGSYTVGADARLHVLVTGADDAATPSTIDAWVGRRAKSFATGDSPNNVAETFTFTQEGAIYVTTGSKSGRNTYTRQGNTLTHQHHTHITATLQSNGDLSWSHGYTSRVVDSDQSEPKCCAIT